MNIDKSCSLSFAILFALSTQAFAGTLSGDLNTVTENSDWGENSEKNDHVQKKEEKYLIPIKSEADTATDGETSLPKVTVEAEVESESNPEDDPYNNLDPHNKDYSTSYKSSTTKTNTPLMDSPFSLQVVPREVMNDQRSTTIKDALQNVSGVRSHSNEQEGYAYTIRGFDVLNLYRNSLQVPLSIATTQETANLESVQVLKGPSSILFGRVDPGGTINMVTKSPLFEPYHSLSQEFGTFGHFRTVWDSTSPVTKNGDLAYRFSGSYQNSDTYRDFQSIDRLLISPSLLWKISEATDLKLEVQYLNNDSETDVGFPAFGTRPANIPIRRSFQEANDPNDSSFHVLGSYELTHRFNNDWTFHNRFHAVQSSLTKNNLAPVGMENNGTLHRQYQYQKLDGEAYATNFDINGKFELFGSKHDVLAGFDIFKDHYNYAFTALGSQFFNGNNYDSSLDINIFRPVYGRADPANFSRVITNPDAAFFSNVGIEQFGVYFQDNITLFDKLHILGGGRHDWATLASSFPSKFAGSASTEEVTDEHFSPRVGILYQPKDWLSVYCSWSNSFGLNNGRDKDGNLVKPQTAEQWEGGLKTELFDHRLSATLAYFYLTKNNIVITDPNSTPQNPIVRPIGVSRSQGIEFDMVGQITDNLGVIGNYAYTDGRVTFGDVDLQGKRLPNVAEHSGRLFLTYDFKNHDVMDGWRFGLGITAVGSRKGNALNTFILPGFARFDAFAAYSINVGKSRITAQLNLENLTDKKYFDGTDSFFNAASNLAIYTGSPFAAKGTIRVEF
ncbi:MAG: TonB-dependent siderophore receptor [Methylococcaceae bacterium]|nr:TonB-dependent siderophore receptor [Methylococcaceae bacterium]